MKRVIGLIGVVCILLVCGLVFLIGVDRVKPGYVGVVQSKATGNIVVKSKIGWTFINPFTQQFVEYPISTEYLILTAAETEGSEQNDSIDAPTLEGQNVNVDVAVAFHVTDAKSLYIKYRGASVDYLKQVVIRNSLNSNLMAVTGKMSILSINEESDKICSDTKDRMNKQLNAEGIVIERVELRSKRLPKEVQASFNAKIEAENKIRQAESKKKQATIEAESLLIKAEAEAKANKMISDSITPTLVQLRSIEKLNPKVQVMYVPQGSNMLLQTK